MINYGFTKEIDATFEEALDKISDELKKEGIGIPTRIDVAENIGLILPLVSESRGAPCTPPRRICRTRRV